MSKTTDWRVTKVHRDILGRPYKRILMRYLPASDEVEICEEWLEDAVIDQAQLEREKPMFQSNDMKALAVIPPSVEARAIREGWMNDPDAWAKWAKDIDNRKVQV